VIKVDRCMDVEIGGVQPKVDHLRESTDDIAGRPSAQSPTATSINACAWSRPLAMWTTENRHSCGT